LGKSPKSSSSTTRPTLPRPMPRSIPARRPLSTT
jgi:hypothetical protein